MRLLSLLFAAAPALAVTYEGQIYSMTFNRPNADNPWFTGGYNTIDVTTLQTLICCPPLPPVSWILRNEDTSLLPQQLTLQDHGNFTPPENPPIESARAGQNYVLYAVLSTNESEIFGQSDPFPILDGATSPPLISPPRNGTTTPNEQSLTNTGTNTDTAKSSPMSTPSGAAPETTASTPVTENSSASGSQAPTSTSSGSVASTGMSTGTGTTNATASTPPTSTPSNWADRTAPVVAFLAAAVALADL